MTHEQMYEAVRGKVIEVCPENVEIVESFKDDSFTVIQQPIRLSHVLRAMDKDRKELMSASLQGGSLVVKMGEQHMVWHLADDDLSKQSPEVIKFLYPILVESIWNS